MDKATVISAMLLPVREFAFQFFHRGQLGLQGFGQGAHQFVLGNAYGFVDAGEGIFGNEAVLRATEQDADGGVVVVGFDLRVHGGEIEIELPGVFGLEGGGLELHHHIAFEADVVKQQIDEKFIPAHFKTELPPDIGKAAAELQQKTGDVFDQRLFDVALVRFFAKPEKIEKIRVRVSCANADCAAGRRAAKLLTACP